MKNDAYKSKTMNYQKFRELLRRALAMIGLIPVSGIKPGEEKRMVQLFSDSSPLQNKVENNKEIQLNHSKITYAPLPPILSMSLVLKWGGLGRGGGDF